MVNYMNLDNAVLVRAMNHLPLDGRLIPSFQGNVLVNDNRSQFFYHIKSKLDKYLEEQLGRPLDVFNNPQDEILQNKLLEQYGLLTGPYYTTTLSFSLNGLVPDDRHNKFSELKIAVLDPLKNHVSDNFITVHTIDTTIKGEVNVSKEAILLIDQQFFMSLPEDIKSNLISNYNVKLFTGSLKSAVDSTLRESNCPSFSLIQDDAINNIEDNVDKESILDFEYEFAEKVGAVRTKLQFMTYMYQATGDEVDRIAHDKVKEEFPKSLKIDEYYKNQLYTFILAKAESFGIDISDRDKYSMFTNEFDGIFAMQNVVDTLIEAYGGIYNFQAFIQEYNEYVKMNYRTNEQIIMGDGLKRD